jgi:hypothetical protein
LKQISVPVYPAQARKEMQAIGLQWEQTLDFLPQQHFMVFSKPLH